MNSWSSELEIVGFNGKPLVECGRALPVARRKADGQHCVLDLTNGPENLQWYPQEVGYQFANEHRWTLFGSPLNLPKKCFDETQSFVERPMVVYTNQRLLDYADRQFLPEMWNKEYLIWKKLTSSHDDYQATCGTSSCIETLMNDWANGLLKRFDAMLRIGRDNEYLLRVADFALCAAIDRPVRWEAYLRYSLAQKPDKVRRTFNSLIGREFKDVTWEDFIENRHKLSDVLLSGLSTKSVEPVTVSSSTSSTMATALPKVRGIAAAPPIPTEQLIKQ